MTLFSLMGGIEQTVSCVVNDGQFWRFIEQEPRHVAHFIYDYFRLQQTIHAASSSGDPSDGEEEGSTSSLLTSDNDFDG